MTGTVGVYNYISNKLVPYFDYKKGTIEKLKKTKQKNELGSHYTQRLKLKWIEIVKLLFFRCQQN
jgi:hypothetical protein